MATWCEQPKEPDKSKETHSEIEVTLKADTEVTENSSKIEQVCFY